MLLGVSSPLKCEKKVKLLELFIFFLVQNLYQLTALAWCSLLVNNVKLLPYLCIVTETIGTVFSKYACKLVSYRLGLKFMCDVFKAKR